MLQRMQQFHDSPSLVEGLFAPMLRDLAPAQNLSGAPFSRARRGVGAALATATEFGPVIRIEVQADGIGQEEFVQATARAMANEVVQSMLSQLESIVSGVGGLVSGG